MVIDVDKELALFDALGHDPEPFQARGVRRDHTIKLAPRLGRLQKLLWVQKCQFLRHRILVPTTDLFALRQQGQGQSELRSDAISVRTDMPDHTDRFAAPNPLENAINDLWVSLHEAEKIAQSRRGSRGRDSPARWIHRAQTAVAACT